MNKIALESISKLIVLAIVWWGGMGFPIPKTKEEACGYAVSFFTFMFAGYKNFDFSKITQKHTLQGREEKLLLKLGKSVVIEDEDEEE